MENYKIEINSQVKYLLEILNETFKKNSNYTSEITLTSTIEENNFAINVMLYAIVDKKLYSEIELVSYYGLKRVTNNEEINKNIYYLLLNSIIDKDMYNLENLSPYNNDQRFKEDED